MSSQYKQRFEDFLFDEQDAHDINNPVGLHQALLGEEPSVAGRPPALGGDAVGCGVGERTDQRQHQRARKRNTPAGPAVAERSPALESLEDDAVGLADVFLHRQEGAERTPALVGEALVGERGREGPAVEGRPPPLGETTIDLDIDFDVERMIERLEKRHKCSPKKDPGGAERTPALVGERTPALGTPRLPPGPLRARAERTPGLGEGAVGRGAGERDHAQRQYPRQGEGPAVAKRTPALGGDAAGRGARECDHIQLQHQHLREAGASWNIERFIECLDRAPSPGRDAVDPGQRQEPTKAERLGIVWGDRVVERSQRELVAEQQARLRQRAEWDRQMGRMSRLSPEARRSGRRVSGCARKSSRSRSPRACERRAMEDSYELEGVMWTNYMMSNPPLNIVAREAEMLVQSYLMTDAGCLGGTVCYVGVTRYVRRRWLGGDGLEPGAEHCMKWQRMYILGNYAVSIGTAEDGLIQQLRARFGEEAVANVKGGGGGTSPYKPSLLYLCVGRRLSIRPCNCR